MAFVEKTAKTVDLAVAEALKELNITQDDAVIEVLEEPKDGFLGIFGRKDAKVRVTVREKTVSEAAADAVDAVKEAAGLAAKAVAEKAGEIKESVKADVKAAAEDLSEKADEVKKNVAEAAEELGKKAEAAKKELEAKKEAKKAEKAAKAEKEDNGEKAEKPQREPRKYVVTDEAVAAAKEFLQKVFNTMKIEVVMEKFINKTEGSVTFRLHGEDMGILIGKHGQTLDALQYLTNLVANKNSSERIRIIIDVEDYRDRRVETLTRLANRLAEKVKRTGERISLEPMNPHERKIIHMALQNDRKVTTLSEGDAPYRHVVIELKKKEAKAAKEGKEAKETKETKEEVKEEAKEKAKEA